MNSPATTAAIAEPQPTESPAVLVVVDPELLEWLQELL